MTIFLTDHRRPYRDVVDRFMFAVSFVNKQPRSKFAIMCALETSHTAISRLLKIALDRGLITTNSNNRYIITARGRDLVEVWNS